MQNREENMMDNNQLDKKSIELDQSNEIEKQTEFEQPTELDKTPTAQAGYTIFSNARFAGFWMRFWAYLLDLIVIGSIDRILVNPIFRATGLDLHSGDFFAPVTIATAITFYGYFVLMTKFFGQTLGKMVFGLRVIDLHGEKLTWKSVLFREWIGRFISTFLIILYVVVAFLPKKQGIHDLFADTAVVHEH